MKNMPCSTSTGSLLLGAAPWVGSGKFGCPWERMHRAKANALRSSLSDMCVEGPPFGRYFLHTCWADRNAGDRGLSPVIWRPPPEPGSGKLERPCARMHRANASAPAAFDASVFALPEEPQAATSPAHVSAISARRT